MKELLTRKEFFESSARTAVGVSAGFFGGTLLTAAVAGANDDQVRQEPITARAVTEVKWPWPYATLDPEDVRKRGHKFYYDGGCAYGAFNALVSALAEKVGEPYTSMPPQLFYFGGGGGAGWGTLCGALNGAGGAISLFVDRSNASAIIGELFGWYTNAKFPSDISNDYATRQAFLVNRNDKALVQTVSSTPLCHGSVSKWCNESRFKSSAPERAERCARLTGDTVARAVELVNQYFAGQFKAAFKPVAAVSECMSCHDATYGSVISTVKMDCRQCHNDTWDHLY